MTTASSLSYVSTASDITNFARLGIASQNELPNIFRELLFIKEPPHLLESHLTNNSFLSQNLKAHEWNIISTVRTNQYRDFDISLMYKIIRNLNLVPNPTQGWDSQTPPLSTEITVGDDIERMRRVRNEIVHRGNTNVTDAELAHYFSMFKDIAHRLEIFLMMLKREFVSKIENAETCCIDKDTENRYICRLKDLDEQEKLLAISVKEMQKSLTNMTEKISKLEIDMQKHREKEEAIPKNIQAELRIALIGNNGYEKSSTANTIMGENKFDTHLSFVSHNSVMQSGVACRFGRNINVVEFPSLFDRHKSVGTDAILKEIKKAFIVLTPGPHAIILVVRSERYRIEDRDTINVFVQLFQKEMFSHFFVIFTGADILNGENLHSAIKNSRQSDLNTLIKNCSGRYVAFDNRNSNIRQVEELIEMIEENLRNHDGKAYSNAMFDLIEKQLCSEKITPQQLTRDLKDETPLGLKVLTNFKIKTTSIWEQFNFLIRAF